MNLLQDEDSRTIGIWVSVGVALVLTWMAVRSCRRRAYRQFFRATFLPEANKQGIALDLVLAILRDIDPANPEILEGIRGLAKNLPLLLEVLREDDPLAAEKWGRESLKVP